MSKLPGKWKDVPVNKIINWLGHPANVIDDNDETALDRCKRVKELNHFVQPLMDNGGLTSTAVRTMWDLVKEHYTREEQESLWTDFWKEWEKKQPHEERKRKKKKKKRNKNKIQQVKRRTMAKTINTNDISIGVNNDTEAIKNLMQYYINLPVNHMTTEGKTPLDAVEENTASEDIKEQMRVLLKQYNGFTGEEIRKMKQYILNNQ